MTPETYVEKMAKIYELEKRAAIAKHAADRQALVLKDAAYRLELLAIQSLYEILAIVFSYKSERS